jgi:hypothetical protein
MNMKKLVLLLACALMAQGVLKDSVREVKSGKIPMTSVYRLQGVVVKADTVNRRMVLSVDKAQDTLFVEHVTQLVRGVKKEPLSGFSAGDKVSCSYELRQGRKYALRIEARRIGVSGPKRPEHPRVPPLQVSAPKVSAPPPVPAPSK